MFYKYKIEKIICTSCLLLVFLIFLACAAPIEAPPSKCFPLFETKCSTCHTLERVLIAGKDETAWRKTILEMSKKEGSQITEDEVEKLVEYHVERQKREQEIFEKDCCQCHCLKRSLTKQMTPSEWRKTIRRMQKKAPETIGDEDIDLLVNFHIRSQRTKMWRMLNASLGREPVSSVDLFMTKCSTCHTLERALITTKDEAAWRKTILEMRRKEGSKITEDEAERLAEYHVERQKKEQEIFEKDCSQCHELDRSIGKLKTHSGWCETIRRMQNKAPGAICDEETDVLVYYHVRKGKMLSDLFLKKCSKCHSPERALRAHGDWIIWEKTILEMKNKHGSGITANDAKKLIKYHVKMQKEEQEIFEKDCALCHPAERSLGEKHTPSEWREVIRRMQKKAPDLISDEEIDILVNYHVRRSQ